MSKLCIRCGGTGQYLGTGMMLQDCYCDIDEQPTVKKSVALESIDRRSKSYRDAIDNLMKLNPKLTRDGAVKLFNETYDRV